MGRVRERLAELGLSLPAVPAPAGSYLPALRSGDLVFTAGQIPVHEGVIAATGKVGAGVSTEQATRLARVCALNAIAAVGSVVDLDDVVRVVKVVGFVASDASFTEQPEVVNGASDLLAEIFGEAGRHARSAVGVAVLPRDVPVEIELVVEVSPT